MCMRSKFLIKKVNETLREFDLEIDIDQDHVRFLL